MVLLKGSTTTVSEWYVKSDTPTLYCRIYYVRAGAVTYRDEHTVRCLKSGHLYVFPATRPYEMTQDPAQPLTCLYLHLDSTPYLFSELLEVPVEKESFLYYLLETMESWIANDTSTYGDPVAENLAMSLINYLDNENLLQKVPEKLASTISYIAEHVREKITVKELSELCGYHTQYYIRLFCLHLGITPHQYLISYRMKRAVSLLNEGRSVAETADMVGYREVRNFIRGFKKYYGYSPSQVKRYTHVEF